MFTLSRWPYIRIPPLLGNVKADVAHLLTVNGKPKTAVHCVAVADANQKFAARFGLDQTAAYNAALLHDIANIMQPQDMLAYAVLKHWELDESERKHPFLLHQRVSAVIAKAHFHIRDERVLSAIGCHTTLKADPSDDDMALFLADKLSWDQDGIPPYEGVVSAALNKSLYDACLVYIRFVLDHNMLLLPHKRFLAAKNWLEKHG